MHYGITGDNSVAKRYKKHVDTRKLFCFNKTFIWYWINKELYINVNFKSYGALNKNLKLLSFLV